MAKSKIIKDIANSKVDIVTTLKRTKLLVSDLNDAETLKWLNYEISGYPKDVPLPSYRKTRGILKGTYYVKNLQFIDVAIPLGNMPVEQEEKILSVEVRDGICPLKNAIEKNKKYKLSPSSTVDVQIFPFIAKYNNQQSMLITSARVEFSEIFIDGIFSNVENKILGILLALEKEFGCLDDLDIDVTTKSDEEIKKIKEQIRILVYNDNSIKIGDSNKITDTTIASDINNQAQN